MIDPLTRFSNRSENYAKFRPGYPAAVIEILKSDCGLTPASVIADVGSGTGILSELLLRNGNSVFAVEPNAAMRQVAEATLSTYPNFTNVDATAEATTLDTAGVDFVTAAQAFHWFDRAKAKREFARILRPGGWVVLIWNERRLDSSKFLRAYEDLLLRYGTDYEKVRHERVNEEIAEFYSPETFAMKAFANVQRLDFQSLKGRLLSSSYAPELGQPNFPAMLERLKEIFEENQKDGTIDFEYDAKVFYGQLHLPQLPSS